MDKKYSIYKLQNMITQIIELKTKEHYVNIFNICHNYEKNKFKYTKNSNGIFIDVNKLSNVTLKHIFNYIKEHKK